MRMILHWILSAVALLIVSRVVPGFIVHGILAALLAAVVIGFINATLGALIKILTLGIFWLIINAAMIKLASMFVPGFQITGLAAAFWGAIVLSIVNMFLKWLVFPKRS